MCAATDHIRDRRPADVPGVVALLRETHEHDGYPQSWPSDPAGFAVPDSELRAWVATSGDHLVGHVSLLAAEHDPVLPVAQAGTGRSADGLVVLARLAVGRAARGTGLGRRLVDIAVAAARADGRQAVLDVNKRSTAAADFYERLGWRRVGELAMTVHDDHVLDLWVYAAPEASDNRPA